MGRRVFAFCGMIPAIGLVWAACATGCSSSSSPPGGDGGTNPIGPVTFHKDVQPILQAHCQQCHTEGGIAPFVLKTYDQAKTWSGSIVSDTSKRVMPPFGAQETSECTPRFGWKHDARLSQREIDVLAAWQQQGTPQGDPKDAKPDPSYALDPLPNKTAELAPQQPWTLTDTTKDSFRCVVLDPKITQTTWVNGVAFLPGNKAISHHAVLFIDPDGESKAKAGPDGTYECFGSANLKNQGLLGAWAPGAPPRDYPSNIGMELKPGTLIVAQMHYHPSSDANANKQPDPFKLQLRATTTQPEYNLVFALIGNFAQPLQNGTGIYADPGDPNALSSFKIPANTKDKTVTMRFTLPPMINNAPTPHLYIYGVGAHMHYVGVKENVTIHRAIPTGDDPKDECLLSVPRWDFNWQQAYAYDVPDITKLPGMSPFDSFDIKCTYDNTMGNPFVVGALKDQGLSQPRDVNLGETTLDEMCLGVFEAVYKK